MRDVEIVREAMYVKRVKMSELAERCGYKYSANITSLLSAKDGMRTSSLVKLLSVLGYDVLVVDKNDGKQFFKLTAERESAAPVRYSISPTEENGGGKYTGKTYEELYDLQKHNQEILMNASLPKEEREAAKTAFIELSIILKEMEH